MEENDFEDRLRRFHAKQPPAGVRERLLGRAEQEMAARRRGRLRGWRLRLAMAAAVLIALAADLAAERVTNARIAALTDGRAPAFAQHDDDALRAAMHERATLLSMVLRERDWQWGM